MFQDVPILRMFLLASISSKGDRAYSFPAIQISNQREPSFIESQWQSLVGNRFKAALQCLIDSINAVLPSMKYLPDKVDHRSTFNRTTLSKSPVIGANARGAAVGVHSCSPAILPHQSPINPFMPLSRSCFNSHSGLPVKFVVVRFVLPGTM